MDCMSHVRNPVHLDLSKKNLEEIPKEIYAFYPLLQYLYFGDNKITEIPDDFFPTLKNLRWLDLRNNLLTTIPPTIANHEHLETLLLKNNLIEVLPLEIGQVPLLSGLQLQGNPLRSPSPSVVNAGAVSVLRWLREEALARVARGAVVSLPAAPARPVAQPSHGIARTAASEDGEEVEEEEEATPGAEAAVSPSRERLVALLPASTTSSPKQPATERRSGGTEKASGDGSALAAVEHTVAALSNRKKTQIIKRMLTEMWLAKVSEKLLEQDKELERRKSEEALVSWRMNCKRRGVELLKNYHFKAPYDLHFSEDIEGLTKRTPQKRLEVEDLGALENVLIANMTELEGMDPEEQRKALARRMHTLTDLQRRLQAVRFKALEDKTYYTVPQQPVEVEKRKNM